MLFARHIPGTALPQNLAEVFLQGEGNFIAVVQNLTLKLNRTFVSY